MNEWSSAWNACSNAARHVLRCVLTLGGGSVDAVTAEAGAGAVAGAAAVDERGDGAAAEGAEK